MFLKNSYNIKLMDNQSSAEKWQQIVRGLDPKQVESYQNEMLIKVDEKDTVLGPISKGESHFIDTIKKGIYHRALSLLVFDEQGRFLLTQRAACKITFSNYFTNACCSHPKYNQLELEDDGNAIGVKRAVMRRSSFELGIETDSIKLDELKLVNRIAYRAESDGGNWGESEIDYIFILKKDIKLNPNYDELQSLCYVTRDQMQDILSNTEEPRIKVTPWLRLLARELLFKYWDNLDNLDRIAQPESIISFKNLISAD